MVKAKRLPLNPAGPKPMSERKYRVMVVDDDESVRESLRKLLGHEGYDVTLAADGAEAVEMFRQAGSQVDLLLVDLNMPLKNGWATLDRLLEVDRSLPVFVLTGLSNQYELAEAAGVSVLVEKPIDVPGLLQLMQRQLTAPVPSHLQAAGRQAFPFYCLRAAHDTLPGPETELHIAPYDHWGLNE